MHSVLRRMGKLTGLIVPKAVLREAGIVRGTTLDLIVENGRIIATQVRDHPRAGWAEAAALIAEDSEITDEAFRHGLADWYDRDLTW